MLVYQQLAVRQVGIELGDVGLGVGDIRGAAEVVTMIEEDFLVMCGVGRHVAITWLRIVRVFGFLPLNGWTRDIPLVVELWTLHPTFGHRVVAQLSDDGVVAITRVVGIGRCTLHRGHSRWRAQLAVVLLALFFYLHHTGGIVLLSYRNIVATDTIDIVELAHTELTCYAFITDKCVICQILASVEFQALKLCVPILGIFMRLDFIHMSNGRCSYRSPILRYSHMSGRCLQYHLLIKCESGSLVSQIIDDINKLI